MQWHTRLSDERERERLRWQCRRGMLELDLLLQKFVSKEFDRLGERERLVLRRVLDLPDGELMAYCLGQAVPDDPEVLALVRKIAG